MFLGEKSQFDSFKKINKELLSTNVSSYKYSVQRWANFIAGFSIEFVESCLEKFHPEDGFVLDPYAGCGTTLVAARSLGFYAIGYDPHIIFSTLCRTKISDYSISDLHEVANIFFRATKKRELSKSAKRFLDKLFSPRKFI